MKFEIELNESDRELLSLAIKLGIFGKTPYAVGSRLVSLQLHKMVESEFFRKAIETQRLLKAHHAD